MMTKKYNEGSKGFSMIYDTIDTLVPEDHIVRKYEKAIDWSFIYPLVEPLYSNIGAPSIDPVVLFKMAFLVYLSGVGSMRKLCEEIQVNLAYRWFLHIDFCNTVPNYSTFSQNLSRKFLKDNNPELFEKIFNHILNEAIKNDFIDPTSIYIDGTHVKASANKKKYNDVVIKIASKRYKEDLKKSIDEDRKKHNKKPFNHNDDEDNHDDEDNNGFNIKSTDEMVKDEQGEEVVSIIYNDNGKKIGYKTVDRETGEIKKRLVNENYRRIKQSKTDKECGLYNKGEHEKVFAYNTSIAVDKNCYILSCAVTAGNIHDSVSFYELEDELKKQRFYKHVNNYVMDAGYKAPGIMKYLIDNKKEPLIPYTRPKTKKGYFKKYEFVYDEIEDYYICPGDYILLYSTTTKEGYREYKAEKEVCAKCPLREKCTNSKQGKVIIRHVWEEYMEKAEENRYRLEYQGTYKKRKETVERVFGEGKENYGLRYTKVRGKARVKAALLLTFASMNLKKIARWKSKKQRLVLNN